MSQLSERAGESEAGGVSVVRACMVWVVLSACAPRVAPAPVESTLTLGRLLSESTVGAVGPVRFEATAVSGKVVLVTFIASWCFPCVTDMVALRRLDADHGAEGLVQLFVGMDVDGVSVLVPFAQGADLPGPLLVASREQLAGNTKVGLVRELPSRILFGRDGVAIAAGTGVVDFVKTDSAIREALGTKGR